MHLQHYCKSKLHINQRFDFKIFNSLIVFEKLVEHEIDLKTLNSKRHC